MQASKAPFQLTAGKFAVLSVEYFMIVCILTISEFFLYYCLIIKYYKMFQVLKTAAGYLSILNAIKD